MPPVGVVCVVCRGFTVLLATGGGVFLALVVAIAVCLGERSMLLVVVEEAGSTVIVSTSC